MKPFPLALQAFDGMCEVYMCANAFFSLVFCDHICFDTAAVSREACCIASSRLRKSMPTSVVLSRVNVEHPLGLSPHKSIAHLQQETTAITSAANGRNTAAMGHAGQQFNRRLQQAMTDLAFNMSDQAKATFIPKSLSTVEPARGCRPFTGIACGHNMIRKSFRFSTGAHHRRNRPFRSKKKGCAVHTHDKRRSINEIFADQASTTRAMSSSVTFSATTASPS